MNTGQSSVPFYLPVCEQDLNSPVFASHDQLVSHSRVEGSPNLSLLVFSPRSTRPPNVLPPNFATDPRKEFVGAHIDHHIFRHDPIDIIGVGVEVRRVGEPPLPGHVDVPGPHLAGRIQAGSGQA